MASVDFYFKILNERSYFDNKIYLVKVMIGFVIAGQLASCIRVGVILFCYNLFFF